MMSLDRKTGRGVTLISEMRKLELDECPSLMKVTWLIMTLLRAALDTMLIFKAAFTGVFHVESEEMGSDCGCIRIIWGDWSSCFLLDGIPHWY